MRLPWRRRAPRGIAASRIPEDWIELELWTGWEAPRNYIAGEASYRKALAELAGPTCKGGYCFAAPVVFVREPENRYDPKALRAEVRGHHVGYLRRHMAAQVASPLDDAGLREFEVCGVVRGGSTTTPNLGVHVWLDRTLTPGVVLDLDVEDDEWSVPWPPPSGGHGPR